MKTIFKTLIVTSSLVLSGLTSAAEFTLPEYQTFTLDNGLRVYLMEQHEVPLIDVIAVVKAGAVQDDKAGVAALTADTLLLGTKNLNKADFEAQLDFIGADISSHSGLESTYLSASMAKKDQDKVLALVRDALLSPAFKTEEFEKHRTRYLSGLEQQKESPRAVIRNHFNGLLFGEHPYANIQDGTPSSVANISLNDLRKFHSAWYTPDNAAIVVAGDFDSKQMKSKIVKLFKSWKGNAPKFELSDDLPKPDKARVLLVNKSDANESTFMIGGPGVKASNPDRVAISVINTILGARFTSWLNDELRVNSGLTYGARSSFDDKLAGGSFAISTFTRSSSTKEAIDLALATYARLWEKGIDEETLSSAKAYVKGLFPTNYETSTELAGFMADMFVYGFDESYINNFSDQVNKLTIARSKELVNQYFPQKNLQFVVVGKAEEIRDLVAVYGELSEAEIKD